MLFAAQPRARQRRRFRPPRRSTAPVPAAHSPLFHVIWHAIQRMVLLTPVSFISGATTNVLPKRRNLRVAEFIEFRHSVRRQRTAAHNSVERSF